MREMGVRELKLSLSRTLQAVSRGQRVRVTLRGRAMADIIPSGAAAEEDQLARLVTEGRLVAPTRARPKRAPQLVTSARSASSVVLSEREVDR